MTNPNEPPEWTVHFLRLMRQESQVWQKHNFHNGWTRLTDTGRISKAIESGEDVPEKFHIFDVPTDYADDFILSLGIAAAAKELGMTPK